MTIPDMVLPPEVQLGLVAEASRAPSAHNTQPARWHFERDQVTLYEDPRRRLAAGDPMGRDHRIGLGAAWEGMALALARRRLTFTPPADVRGERTRGLYRPVVRGRLVTWPGDAGDSLAEFAYRRRTWRGSFRSPSTEERDRLRALMRSSHDVAWLTEREPRAAAAELHDRCLRGQLADPAVLDELRRWLRLTPAGSESGDGLTAACLRVTPVERILAGLLFRPAVFRALERLGLGRLVVSEAAATRTATALAVFHRPADEDALVSGRRFYRFWLELTAAGYAACPMSALVDAADGVAWVRGAAGVPADRAVINVFRIGPAPARIPESPRLAPRELLLSSSD